jgi:hypothetical protein
MRSMEYGTGAHCRIHHNVIFYALLPQLGNKYSYATPIRCPIMAYHTSVAMQWHTIFRVIGWCAIAMIIVLSLCVEA